jgi:hypothetical protein
MTLGIMTLGIMTLGITTHTALSKKTLCKTVETVNHDRFGVIKKSVIILIVFAPMISVNQ